MFDYSKYVSLTNIPYNYDIWLDNFKKNRFKDSKYVK